MFGDPGIDLATRPIIEQMRQISLNRFTSSSESRRKIAVQCGNYFNLLDLPSEIVARIFTFLPIADRMRARVSRRLDEIEARCKFYADSVLIAERLVYPPDYSSNDIIFLDGKSYSSDCIRRIARNTTIGCLKLELYGSESFHREVYNLIQNVDCKRLDLIVMSDAIEKEFIIDSFFLDQASKREVLTISGYEDITSDDIHHMYKLMIDGSSRLRNVRATCIKNEVCVSFLRLIGIIFRFSQFYATRYIEAREEFLDDDDDEVCVHFFDGRLEIAVTCVDLNGHEGVVIELVSHATSEALEKAKNAPGLMRFRVYPEQLLDRML